MQRLQWSIHNGILKYIVCSSMNYISLFMILKSDYLQFSTLYKSDSRISTAKTHVGTIRVKHFRARITMLFSTFKKKSDITIFAWRVT